MLSRPPGAEEPWEVRMRGMRTWRLWTAGVLVVGMICAATAAFFLFVL